MKMKLNSCAHYFHVFKALHSTLNLFYFKMIKIISKIEFHQIQ